MIANLPMYDLDDLRPATDALWALVRDGLRAKGIDAPEALCRGTDLWKDWQSPDLILGQTCGYPYRTLLHDKVQLVGTPDYGLEGAPAGYYYSQLVVAADAPGEWQDFLNGRLAINGADSQSGWAAPQNHAATIGRRFNRIILTGAHRESARAVAEGRADIAAIDAVTWRLLATYLPETWRKLRVVGQTEPTPGLPLVTAKGNDAKQIAAVVDAAIAQLTEPAKSLLGLCGFCQIGAAAYMAVPTPPLPPELSQFD